jgi:alpha-L-fucosidase
MLGVPPMKNGKFSDMETQILKAFGLDIKRAYSYKVSKNGAIEASSTLSDKYSAENLLDDDEALTWRPADNDSEPEITITLPKKDMFDKVCIMENIANGQHIEGYEVYIDEGTGKFKKVGSGGIVGYKRIHKITPCEVARVKVKITSYRGKLELQSVTMY